DQFTDRIEKSVKALNSVSKVTRSGILSETVYLMFSQERLAAYSLKPGTLQDALRARNITTPGGRLDVEGLSLNIDPSGEFRSEKEIADMAVASSPAGTPVYLRDVVDIARAYENPPSYLNYYQQRDAHGRWQRSRAITL